MEQTMKPSKDAHMRAKTRYPDYHDFASDDTEQARSLAYADSYMNGLAEASSFSKAMVESFPYKLHVMLSKVEGSGHSGIVRWLPHGRAFKIYDTERFEALVAPVYFERQTKFASFQRQLNMYGFLRLVGEGPSRKGYYHERFLRGRPQLTSTIERNCLATYSVRKTYDPDSEPNFDGMMPLPNEETKAIEDESRATRPTSVAIVPREALPVRAEPTNVAGTTPSMPAQLPLSGPMVGLNVYADIFNSLSTAYGFPPILPLLGSLHPAAAPTATAPQAQFHVEPFVSAFHGMAQLLGGAGLPQIIQGTVPSSLGGTSMGPTPQRPCIKVLPSLSAGPLRMFSLPEATETAQTDEATLALVTKQPAKRKRPLPVGAVEHLTPEDSQAYEAHVVPSHSAYQDFSEKGLEWASLQTCNLNVDRETIVTGGAAASFPNKLNAMLELVNESGHSGIVRWLPHGRAFKIYDKVAFQAAVLPIYFQGQTKLASFQRQLNIYGFKRLTRRGDDDYNAYYHERFLRGRSELRSTMSRNFLSGQGSCSMDPLSQPDLAPMSMSGQLESQRLHPTFQRLFVMRAFKESKARVDLLDTCASPSENVLLSPSLPVPLTKSSDDPCPLRATRVSTVDSGREMPSITSGGAAADACNAQPWEFIEVQVEKKSAKRDRQLPALSRTSSPVDLVSTSEPQTSGTCMAGWLDDIEIECNSDSGGSFSTAWSGSNHWRTRAKRRKLYDGFAEAFSFHESMDQTKCATLGSPMGSNVATVTRSDLASHSTVKTPLDVAADSLASYPVYRDHSQQESSSGPRTSSRSVSFLDKLSLMLMDVSCSGHSSIGWLPHGRAFKIYDKKVFAKEVLPLYFQCQSKFSTFQRHLGMYGFLRLPVCKDGLGQNESYYHEKFLRGHADLISMIPRIRLKSHSMRRALDPRSQPDFFKMLLPDTTIRFNPCSDSALQLVSPRRDTKAELKATDLDDACISDSGEVTRISDAAFGPARSIFGSADLDSMCISCITLTSPDDAKAKHVFGPERPMTGDMRPSEISFMARTSTGDESSKWSESDDESRHSSSS